jgi:hypothetical protein
MALISKTTVFNDSDSGWTAEVRFLGILVRRTTVTFLKPEQPVVAEKVVRKRGHGKAKIESVGQSTPGTVAQPSLAETSGLPPVVRAPRKSKQAQDTPGYDGEV